jgi:hypothetical protein
MRKTIIGIALLTILILSGCDVKDGNIISSCHNRGFQDGNWLACGDGSQEFICFTKGEGNTIRTSTVYTFEKQSKCEVYNVGDGCAN